MKVKQSQKRQVVSGTRGPEMYKKRNLIQSIGHKTNFKVGNQLRPLQKFSGQDLGRYRYPSQV